MEFKERIRLFIESQNLTKSKFEREAGLSNGYINNVKGNPSEDKLRGILSAFPELNVTWLLTGEGEMLKSSITQTSGDHSSNIANSEVSYSDSKLLEKALDEVTEMRKLVQEQVSINKAQTDRFLTLIERLTTP